MSPLAAQMGVPALTMQRARLRARPGVSPVAVLYWLAICVISDLCTGLTRLPGFLDDSSSSCRPNLARLSGAADSRAAVAWSRGRVVADGTQVKVVSQKRTRSGEHVEERWGL